MDWYQKASRANDGESNQGIALQQDLERASKVWHDWASTKDGWVSIVHGEILCHV